MNRENHTNRTRLVILGSTGSIGKNALDIVRHHHNELEVVGLAGRQNIDLQEKQAREFTPQVIALEDVRRGIQMLSLIHI